MKKTNLFVLASLLGGSTLAYGQATTSSTTLSAAMLAGAQSLSLTSATGVTAQGSLGNFNTILFVDREEMGVRTVSGTVVTVQRGLEGTQQTPHASGATVWLGPTSYFSQATTDPSGACTASLQINLPIFFVMSGNGWTCPTFGPRNGQWTLQYPANAAAFAADNTLPGTSGVATCHARYSFAVDGGAVSTITPATNCTIPINAIIYRVLVDNVVAPVGSTGNVSVGLSAGGAGTAALLGATARGSLTIGTIFEGVPVAVSASSSNTTLIKMTAAGTVTVTVATNALTAGIMDIRVWYYVEQA